jgi:hypothetical protein
VKLLFWKHPVIHKKRESSQLKNFWLVITTTRPTNINSTKAIPKSE